MLQPKSNVKEILQILTKKLLKKVINLLLQRTTTIVNYNTSCIYKLVSLSWLNLNALLTQTKQAAVLRCQRLNHVGIETERRGMYRAAHRGGDGTFCRSAIACFKFLDCSLLPFRSVSCFFRSRRRIMWATSGSWYMSKARSSKGEMDSHLLGTEMETIIKRLYLGRDVLLVLLYTQKKLHRMLFLLELNNRTKKFLCGKEAL